MEPVQLLGPAAAETLFLRLLRLSGVELSLAKATDGASQHAAAIDMDTEAVARSKAMAALGAWACGARKGFMVGPASLMLPGRLCGVAVPSIC
jgi:hypothetical protein